MKWGWAGWVKMITTPKCPSWVTESLWPMWFKLVGVLVKKTLNILDPYPNHQIRKQIKCILHPFNLSDSLRFLQDHPIIWCDFKQPLAPRTFPLEHVEHLKHPEASCATPNVRRASGHPWWWTLQWKFLSPHSKPMGDKAGGPHEDPRVQDSHSLTKGNLGCYVCMLKVDPQSLYQSPLQIQGK